MRLGMLGAMFMIVVMGAGCSTTNTLTLLSTRNVDLSAHHEVIARGAKETDSRFWLLFIPFAGEPSGLVATKKLLEKSEGDYLTNIEVTTTGWSILAVSWGSISVRGDVYQRSSNQPPAAEAPLAP